MAVPLHRHPLSQEVSAAATSTTEYEEETLLPSPHGHHHVNHKHSFSGHLDSRLHAFQVAFFKEAPAPSTLLLPSGSGVQERQGTTLDAEPFLMIEDVQPSKATKEWLMVGLTFLPKISWGWLPFAFSFLGFSVALKLLLFITLFSVYSAAILYRLYLHTDKQGKLTLADIGEAAFGKRLGRRPVLFFCRLIDLALPSICHVGGTSFLQVSIFYSTRVCLPWISLLFGATVLALVQVQRLGGHPALLRIVQPCLAAVAVSATLLKLLLMRAQQGAQAMQAAPVVDEASTIYLSDYVIAVVQLISANYMGQHFFMEEMSTMAAPSTFQHSTAWAQVGTLLANVAVAVATLRVQGLRPHSFISFAFGPDLLSRFINLVLWALMIVKSVVALHLGTKSLLPRLPHLLVSWIDPNGVDSSMHIKPRQLWFLCSSILVLISFVVSNTFPHTFMYLSGLLVSIAYVPIAYTLPCLFSLKLLANQITALEYTLSTWVIPVSIVMSFMGCWACLYQMMLKWNSIHHGGSWSCNLVVPH